MPKTPLPQEAAPELNLEMLSGDSSSLSEMDPDAFTLIVFYRGYHCPVCETYLQKLSELQDDFAERGVNVLAVSMDSQERAEMSADEWGIDNLPLAYGLPEETARDWGLFISDGISDGEPERFSEPGLFLVRPDGTLFYAAVNSMPFGRPHLPSMLEALDFVRAEQYPARGEVA